MTHAYDNARMFLLREGRLLERRLFATIFEDAPAAGVYDALRGYANEDGGFGHGLEPDKRAPDSLPIDAEFALQVIDASGTADQAMLRRACDFLAGVAGPDGGVPVAAPSIEAYPRAEHYTDWTYVPGLFPTAGLVGLLCKLSIDHPWVGRATRFCWDQLDEGLPDDAHALREVCTFLAHVPDRARAEAFIPMLTDRLPKASYFLADPTAEGYGLTPLTFAPAPDSRWRSLFADEVITGHLDRLERDQQPDGGWPIAWEPPGAAGTWEWRGIETLTALRVLAAYGRL